MACCYIAVYMIACVVEACETLDIDIHVQYNDAIDPGKVRDAKRNVKQLVKPTDPTTLSISGMTCAACTGSVERALLEMPGVSRVAVSLLTHEAKIIHGPKVGVAALRKAVQDCGFEAVVSTRTAGESIEILQQTKELKTLKNAFYKISRASSLLFLVNNNNRLFRYITLKRLLNYLITPQFTQMICFILAMLVWAHYGAWIHKSTWAQAKRGRMNMNTLITLSSTLGLLLSVSNLFLEGSHRAETYWQTTVGLIMVVTSGRYVDGLARKTGTKALASLYSLLEDTSYVKMADSKQMIPTSMVKKSDNILIEPFSTIPCDCYAVSGSSLVNESVVTGESVPKTKTVGDFLVAGTHNGRGSLVAIIHETEQGSFLTQMLNTVEDALNTKVRVQDNIDIIIRFFVVFIIGVAAIGALASFHRLDPELSVLTRINAAARKAMTVLAVSCPCALGLSTPCAISAGIDVARRKGVLMTEGARTMEKLSQVTQIVMDKTGTLTEGQLQMASYDLVEVWRDRWEELSVLICAAEELNGVAHPAGLAVFRECLQGIQPQWQRYREQGGLKDLEETPGQGLCCHVDAGDHVWRRVCLGNKPFVESTGVTVSERLEFKSPSKGGLKVYVAVDDQHVGVIHLQDVIRSDAKEAIQRLQKQGLSITMATGDVQAEARRVSSLLGISVVATSALPEAKLQIIKNLQKQGEKVAMIGDGINDAPSLAAADVGIMMAHGKSCLTSGGSVVLLSSQLNAVPALFTIARETMNQVHFNLVWILAYNVIALSLALGAGASWGLTINPSLAAGMMSFSSISVTLLSVRLRNRLLGQIT